MTARHSLAVLPRDALGGSGNHCGMRARFPAAGFDFHWGSVRLLPLENRHRATSVVNLESGRRCDRWSERKTLLATAQEARDERCQRSNERRIVRSERSRP